MAQLLIMNPKRRRRRIFAHRRHRNPHHRRRSHARRHHRIRARNPRRTRRLHMRMRRRHRNPRMFGTLTDDVLMPGLLGAAGGVGLQLIWNAFSNYLPCTIGGNQLLTVVAQGAGAIGVGWLGGKALGQSKGDAVAAGALAIVLYNYVASMISTSPQLQGLRGLRGPRLGVPMRRQLRAYLPGQGLQPRVAGKVSLGAYMPGQGLSPMRAPSVSLGAARAMNPAAYLRGMGPGGMFRRR